MNGWKTKTGGLMLSLTPLIGMINETLNPGHSFITEMWGAAATALMGIGIGHKVDKNGSRLR